MTIKNYDNFNTIDGRYRSKNNKIVQNSYQKNVSKINIH